MKDYTKLLLQQSYEPQLPAWVDVSYLSFGNLHLRIETPGRQFLDEFHKTGQMLALSTHLKTTIRRMM